MTKNKQKVPSNITLDNLALMVQQGFLEVHSQLNGLRKDMDEIKQDVHILKQDVHLLKQDVHLLKQNMEEVKLRLDNVPYRFEMKTLEARVDRLERS